MFEHIGGVPSDNTSIIVTETIKGGGRDVTGRFQWFSEHYRFKPVLMNPDSGWEKGNVENKVGYLHRKELIPIPNYKRLAEDNRCPLKRCDEDIEHEHYDKDTFIGVLFQKDHNALHPLLSITFDTCGYTTARPTSMESSPWIREYTVT